jgi:hypothetical protein
MAHFVHQPLDIAERQIRLLDLLPGSGLIRCHLRHVSLTKAHEKYEALSYCWGAPTAQQVKILVNGLVFFVTPNLHVALLRLRGLGTDHPRTLWIDAICIHQSDTDEKNAQIPFMGDIYSSCQRAIVWLGEHDSFTKSAFKGVEFMASRSHSGEKFNYFDWRQVQRGEQSEGLLQRILVKSRVETLVSVAAFSSLFSRPWFTRVWVIQELALSPYAIVVCGKFQIDWDLIAKAYAISNTNFEVHNHLGTILRFRNWPSDLADDIFCHVIMAWHKDATDPRDKIYGLIGLESMQNDEVLIDVDWYGNPTSFNFYIPLSFPSG